MRSRLIPTLRLVELMNLIGELIPVKHTDLLGLTYRQVKWLYAQENLEPTRARALRENILDKIDETFDPAAPPPGVGSKRWPVAARAMRLVLYDLVDAHLPRPRNPHEDLR